jgi:hypothetical protein
MRRTESLNYSSSKKLSAADAIVRVQISLKSWREGFRVRHNDYLNLMINRSQLNNKGQLNFRRTKSLPSAWKYYNSPKGMLPASVISRKYTLS